jgi:hypothetical protein
LRDEPVGKVSAAWREPILGGPKKSPLEANETLSSYSSRFSAHLRLYGFVIGIVSGADVAHGLFLWVKKSDSNLNDIRVRSFILNGAPNFDHSE